MKSAQFSRDRTLGLIFCGFGAVGLVVSKLLNIWGIPYHPYRLILSLCCVTSMVSCALYTAWRYRTAWVGAITLMTVGAIVGMGLVILDIPQVRAIFDSLTEGGFSRHIETVQESLSHGLLGLCVLVQILLLLHYAQRTGERDEREAALRASEAQFRRTVSEAPFPMMVHGEDGGVLQVSNALLETTGYSLEEISTTAKWTEKIHRDKKGIADSAISRQYHSSQRVHQGEFPVWTKAGEERIWDFSFSPLGRNANGTRLVVGMAVDVTDRKRAEQALRESESRFRSVITTARSVILCLTPEGKVSEWNKEAERVFGRSREDAVGKDYASLRYPESVRGKVREQMQAALRGEEVRDYESVVRSMDGAERVVLWNISPLKDVSGGLLGIIGIGQDITEYKQLQEQLQHGQRLESLGVLAGGIAHDFNNLLVGVLGNADLVMDELGGESDTRDRLQLIRRSAQQAAQLTQQMLAYAGKGQATVEPQDLSTLVKDMCDLLRISISKNVVIREDLGVGLPAIQADAGQLQQVVMNLITNGSEAIGDEGGVMTLSTGMVEADEGFLSETYGESMPAPGEYVYLRVEDTGCGMDGETAAKMFDPFYTTKFTGRGLGLAATLGIIRGHRGVVKVESEIGEGTTIWVLFPPASEAVRESNPLGPPPAGVATGGTILVVDDEETVLSVTRRVLEGAGFEVFCGRDGPEGIEVFRAHHAEIDVVLLDMTMPKMGGPETAAALRTIRPDVHVVLMSGYDEENVAGPSGQGNGQPSFLQKPYGAHRLIEVIQGALATTKGAETNRISHAVCGSERPGSVTLRG